MANISLREYIRKIENQIENGEIDQAIAHSKHILKIYPKHIDSYRLLGKALLEKQKYGDASDIFQRVLSSVPDDFISQIGMSIIREDENNLDAAIWHMERAFEVQPSNKAVQDELRRLYTNRDGVAPPKIRLTRGALVRMYTRGELFNQAIAEIWAALSEDPNRVDLEVILARIYYLLGQKVEATETCSKLISKLPYCYEANKILTEILPGTTREEDEKIFRQRVIDLDPYFQFTDEKIQLTSEVSDTKIMIEYLEWDPMSTSYEQPDWIQSIGLAMDSKQSQGEDFVSWLDDPENLTSDSPKTKDELSDEPEKLEETISNFKKSVKNNSDDFVDPIVPESSREEEVTDIPDWIKDAGWEISSEVDDNLQKGFNTPLPGSLKEGQNEEIKEIEDEFEDEIEPAELPAWIREIAPKEENLDDSDEEDFGIKNLEELFDNIESKDPISNLDNSKAQWKNEFEDETSLPFDEFKDLTDQPILTLNDEKDLDLIDDKGISSTLDKVIEGETQTYDFDSIQNLTEKDIDNQAPDLVEHGDSEEYLDPEIENLSNDQIISDLENEPEDSKDQEAEIDDAWLSSLLVDQEKDGEIDGFGGLDEVKEEIPDWIKSVIDNDDKQTSFSSEKLDENLPDWLSSSIEDSEQDMDDIKITFDESDDLPIEINYDQEISEELSSVVKDKGIDEASDEVSVDTDEIEEKFAEETLSSLENLILREKIVEESEEIALTEVNSQFEIGDVLDELEESQPISESETSDLDSALAWMEGLAAKQGAEEATLISKPEDRFESPPDWISEETQFSEEISDDFNATPSWLKELEIETSDVVIEDEKKFIDELSSDEDEVFLDETKDQFVDQELEGTKENDLEFESEIIAEEPEETLYQTPELEDLIDVQEKIELPDQISEIEEPVNEWKTDEREKEITELTQPEEILASHEPELLEEKSDLVELHPVDDFIDDLPIECESILELETSSNEIKSELIDESSQNIESAEEKIPDIAEPGNLEKLEEAKKLLYSGDLDQSIDIYNSFIKDGHYLNNIILDIQTALNHQYPIDINLWQALGDAFLKDKQLQNALDAYSKAEDLLS